MLILKKKNKNDRFMYIFSCFRHKNIRTKEVISELLSLSLCFIFKFPPSQGGLGWVLRVRVGLPSLHDCLHRPFLGSTPALNGDGEADDNRHDEEGHGEEPPVYGRAIGKGLYPLII